LDTLQLTLSSYRINNSYTLYETRQQENHES